MSAGLPVPVMECVPNFSEGRDPETLAAIADAMRGVGACRLVDVDPDWDTHRTVMTLFGPPADVVEAAFRGVAAALRRIDLRRHRGSHPRMGAADVVPLVPWRGLDLDEVAAWARGLGQRLGAELGLPGWTYGHAATAPERRLLHEVRRGEFEGLEDKLRRLAPDFGPRRPHPSGGACAVGARGVLIAFNVNLDTADVGVARQLALRVREYARVRRDAEGRVLGRAPGRLEAVRAMGWASPRYGCAQVSTNLVDWTRTPPHALVEALREEAAALGARVTGSELVGMIPAGALRAAGDYYREHPGSWLDRAIAGLGLDQARPFDPRRKVIELALGEEEPP